MANYSTKSEILCDFKKAFNNIQKDLISNSFQVTWFTLDSINIMNDLHYNMKNSTFNYFIAKINNHLNQMKLLFMEDMKTHYQKFK